MANLKRRDFLKTISVAVAVPRLGASFRLPPASLQQDRGAGESGEALSSSDEAVKEVVIPGCCLPPPAQGRVGVQGGKDVAEMVVGRGPVLEGTEAAEQIQLLGAKQGDLGETISPSQHGDEAQKQ